MCGPTDAYRAWSDQVSQEGRLRRLPYTAARPRLDFSRNDYLGFSRHPQLIHAARNAARRFGVGATGSRLLSGDSVLAHALERRIARAKRAPRALVFSSGFTLNATVAAALLDRTVLKAEPLVWVDKFVHASLYHAFATAGVRFFRYHHQDLDHLESLLRAAPAAGRPRFLFTESLFGMDGDRTDLVALRELAGRYGALPYIDEAHATGVLGPRGAGLACEVAGEGGVVMGTFSKALGGSGAYLACSDAIATFLLQRSAGFIYSTAPPPPVLAAAITAWRLLPEYEEERRILAERASRTREAIKGLGYDIGAGTTHIISILFAKTDTTARARDHLARAEIAVSFIRPPTVPPNASRLRIALSVTHSEEDIASLLTALSSFPG